MEISGLVVGCRSEFIRATAQRLKRRRHNQDLPQDAIEGIARGISQGITQGIVQTYRESLHGKTQ